MIIAIGCTLFGLCCGIAVGIACRRKDHDQDHARTKGQIKIEMEETETQGFDELPTMNPKVMEGRSTISNFDGNDEEKAKY